MSLDSSLHQTLGCDCKSPKPKSPGSALCAECGLIHMTSEQYAEHLARCRAEVAAMLEPQAEQSQSQPQTEPVRETDDERESRRWFKRRRSGVVAPAA
jgi:hypothetical protein